MHSGGGVAVRYENYEKQLKLAGHETRVLCPNRRTVDTWVLKDDGYITASCMKVRRKMRIASTKRLQVGPLT